MNDSGPPDSDSSEFSEFCASWTVIILGTLLAAGVGLFSYAYQFVCFVRHRPRANPERKTADHEPDRG